MKTGDNVVLVSLHHSMNPRLKKYLGRVGVVQCILDCRQEARVRFTTDAGTIVDWWVKLSRLEKAS